MFEQDEYRKLKTFIHSLKTNEEWGKPWENLRPEIKRVYENDIKYVRRRLGTPSSDQDKGPNQNRKKYYAHPYSLEQAEEDLGLMASNSFSVEEYVLKKELGQALRSAINSLDVNYRQIILLYYFGGQSEGEIGNKLGICQKTVNNRKRKALRLLKKTLEDKGFTSE